MRFAQAFACSLVAIPNESGKIPASVIAGVVDKSAVFRSWKNCVDGFQKTVFICVLRASASAEYRSAFSKFPALVAASAKVSSRANNKQFRSMGIISKVRIVPKFWGFFNQRELKSQPDSQAALR